jgi:3',5'-nucleoside bisphosphate phosphatase
VITEHGYLWTDEQLAALRREAEVGEHFVLLAGQEVPTDFGHVLVLGADRSLAGCHALAKLRSAWPHAVLIWSHPYREGRPREDQLERFDGVEIVSGAHTRLAHYRALGDWHRLKFVATAGSDAHTAETVGRYPTRLDHPVATLSQLCAELRAGRVRPMLEEIPRAGANNRLTEILAGPDERIIVKQVSNLRSWRRVQRALKITAALRDRGFADGRFRVPALLEIDARERLVVEQSQRGELLFELLATASNQTARPHLTDALRWLARLHGADLRIGSPSSTWLTERRRAWSYRRTFGRAPEIRRWLAALSDHQRQILTISNAPALCQVHGDFHPKNLILGHDQVHDPTTRYVCAIDFANSQLHHPALDLAYLLAQLRYQLREYPLVFDEHQLLTIYQAERRHLALPPVTDLPHQLPWFELRAILSIAAYLIKVGKALSQDMSTLMTQAKSLATRLKI